MEFLLDGSQCISRVHEEHYNFYMTIKCRHVKGSVLIRVSTHWVAVLLHSKKLHNVHVPIHGSTVKRSLVVFIQT